MTLPGSAPRGEPGELGSRRGQNERQGGATLGSRYYLRVKMKEMADIQSFLGKIVTPTRWAFPRLSGVKDGIMGSNHIIPLTEIQAWLQRRES